jgi:hypothetical protein
VQKTTAGKPKLERKSTTRQPTPVTPTAAPPSVTGDDISEHSAPRDNPPGKNEDAVAGHTFGPLLTKIQNQNCGAGLVLCSAAGDRASMAALDNSAPLQRASAPSRVASVAAIAKRYPLGPRPTTWPTPNTGYRQWSKAQQGSKAASPTRRSQPKSPMKAQTELPVGRRPGTRSPYTLASSTEPPRISLMLRARPRHRRPSRPRTNRARTPTASQYHRR